MVAVVLLLASLLPSAACAASGNERRVGLVSGIAQSNGTKVPAGALDTIVDDGHGGGLTKPPAEPRQTAPILDPAVGDALTVTITGLPRGTMRNGTVILHPGDHIAPAELSGLTFWPEAGFNGPAGRLSYTVDDGRGGIATGSLDVEVGVAAGLLTPASDIVIWESVRDSIDPADFDGFLQEFPESRYAEDAQRRRAELIAAADIPSKPDRR